MTNSVENRVSIISLHYTLGAFIIPIPQTMKPRFQESSVLYKVLCGSELMESTRFFQNVSLWTPPHPAVRKDIAAHA